MSQVTVRMKDVPKEERPRERLLTYGANHLSNYELLSILLGSGTKQHSVTQLAKQILIYFDGLKHLADATIEELTSIKGIGEAKGVNILAAVELGKRILKYKPDVQYIVKYTQDGAIFVKIEFRTIHYIITVDV